MQAKSVTSHVVLPSLPGAANDSNQPIPKQDLAATHLDIQPLSCEVWQGLLSASMSDICMPTGANGHLCVLSTEAAAAAAAAADITGN
jgi:hypothetical protein